MGMKQSHFLYGPVVTWKAAKDSPTRLLWSRQILLVACPSDNGGMTVCLCLSCLCRLPETVV
ncbi:hypothetical protein ASPZODRAFT_135554 [Penicilliopsis zonata CBS 506.65]|uniref:Uncharacterized protein n=1 Tax=Penicilliopsis zonata CBS 506.65 TaxID=1073090 RepID=A0A1L9SA89_9EURO|nr:hypothetical protein ASPZODRAFT_135554 [Penicilliopsis zonata CBS 506.65]OJJ44093.1 hypothetical protein ASPZODRAFT_135554 [Penicilliopsis zonata CBS 506.65]